VNLKQNTEKAVAGSDQQTVQKVAKKKELWKGWMLSFKKVGGGGGHFQHLL
jgi:hypothetical protein